MGFAENQKPFSVKQINSELEGRSQEKASLNQEKKSEVETMKNEALFFCKKEEEKANSSTAQKRRRRQLLLESGGVSFGLRKGEGKLE
jgi:hypothetical protein